MFYLFYLTLFDSADEKGKPFLTQQIVSSAYTTTHCDNVIHIVTY